LSHLSSLLRLHLGRVNAISGKELARILGEDDDRAIREEIRELIGQGIPIAASTQPPYGYYIVKTQEEAEQYMNQLKNRLINDALRRRDFKKAVKRTLNKEAQLSFL
jgi:biotin operon repressor